MFPHEEERKALEEKMQTSEAKEIFKLRKQIVEPVFGDIKENKGVTTFLTRGLKSVKTEFNLISIANNIIRIHKKRNKILQGNNAKNYHSGRRYMYFDFQLDNNIFTNLRPYSTLD
jgi:transposase